MLDYTWENDASSTYLTEFTCKINVGCDAQISEKSNFAQKWIILLR